MPEEHTLSLGTWEGGPVDRPAGDGGRGEGLGDAVERKSEAARRMGDKSSVIRAARETKKLHNQAPNKNTSLGFSDGDRHMQPKRFDRTQWRVTVGP